MTRFGWLALSIALLVIASIIGGWYLIMRYHAPVAEVQNVATTTTPEQDLSSSSIYTNGVYGFSVIYPAKDTLAGTPLVSLADADGIIRIGASTNAKEVAACTKIGPAETALPDLRLGSTTFKAFTRDNMGTDNQQRITSYRATHEHACIAIEEFQPLVNGSVASSTNLAGMIQSFSFARP
jgi:hypothetical protein